MERTILHCDMNNFYASVECLYNPAIREKPVAVCGNPALRHGIVLAKNGLAKSRGVRTGEALWEAERKCPGLVTVPPHFDRYLRFSAMAREIYAEYTDQVEPFGLDECWLDVTGSLHLFGGDARQLADDIRGRLRQELGLTISVGVSFNKVFAKLGSDYKKPDATTVISRENWRDMVWPLPVGDLLYVGRAARRTLAQYGVETIGQLAACKPEMLEQLMGKTGVQLHRYANGLDDAPVRPQHEHEPVKSVGNSTTFPENLTRWEQVRGGLQTLSDSVAGRLRRQQLYCGGVALTIRDPQFHQFSHQVRLDAPTHLQRDIYRAALTLAQQSWHAPSPIRALTVTALYLSDSADSFQQLDLLDSAAPQRNDRQERLEQAMDTIRRKYGKDAITFGNTGKLIDDE